MSGGLSYRHMSETRIIVCPTLRQVFVLWVRTSEGIRFRGGGAIDIPIPGISKDGKQTRRIFIRRKEPWAIPFPQGAPRGMNP